MREIVDKYARKMVLAGLADQPLICGLDDELIWNRKDPATVMLEQVVAGMQINSLICAEPAEPYQTILRFLCSRFPEIITPQDCETRTFLHDLPVTGSFTTDAILARLRKRKSVIINENDTIRVITYGTVSPEQAFVTFSSVCFSAFVLFFSDFLAHCQEDKVTASEQLTFDTIRPIVDIPVQRPPQLMQGPFRTESQVVQALVEAGRHTVEYKLVDSYFGNISYRLDDTVYISQTGSSLDELGGCIDPCPLDNSSCAGVTASSELSAHNDIFLRTGNLAILHGHPKFSVILSMDCAVKKCPNRGQCHIKCSKKRSIKDIPIVPGEVGTGPTGLCNTLPPAIKGNRGAIVWGHGLFTTGTNDFNEAFKHLLDIEDMCRKEYFARIEEMRP